MNEYRALTAEEAASLSAVTEQLGITEPAKIHRFIDSRLGKVYDVYLIETAEGKIVVKKCDKACRDKTRFDTYFAGGDFAVPKVLELISTPDGAYITMEYAEGSDAKNCGPEDAAKTGAALAQIQSHFLRSGGHTEGSDFHYKEYVEDFCQKIKGYFPDFDSVLQTVQARFFEVPHTLIHDDLLPINVLLGNEKVWIIDWATSGVYPYFLDLARFAFVTDGKDEFYISQESAMAFLDAYYEEMSQNPDFQMDKKRFYLDVAISAFCQYVMFLYYEEDTEHIQSTPDYKRLQKILTYLRSREE